MQLAPIPFCWISTEYTFEFRNALLEATSPKEVLAVIRAEEDKIST